MGHFARLMAESLERDVQLMTQELGLLRATQALDDVPWTVVKVGTVKEMAQVPLPMPFL